MKHCIASLLLIFLANSLVAQDRKNAQHCFEQAELAYLSGRYTDALDQYNRGLVIDAGYYNAYPQRAAVKERLGDWKGAVTDYSIYLDRFPENMEARFSRGLARYQGRQFSFAIDDFRQLLSAPPGGETQTIFYRQSLQGGGTDRIISAQGSIRDYIYNYIGLAAYELKHYAEAIASFDSAIRINPREPDYFVHRGLARQGSGDSDGAERDYNKALELNPDHAVAYHNLGVLRSGRGDKSAGELLDRAIENNPHLSYTYLERGYYRLEKGDYTGALLDYTKALEIDPDAADSWVNRGLVKEKLNDHAGAYADFTKAIAIEPRLEKAWFCRGNVLTRMNRLSEAIEDYTVAILYYPEYGMAWFNRAIVNHRLGYLKEACTDVQRAEALDVQGTDRLRKKVCGE